MATFRVDLLNDENDGNTSAGNLSLREAINLAAANPGADVIDISFVNGTITLGSSLPTIFDNMSFVGDSSNGADIIDGNGVQIFRIVDANVSFSDLTIRQGFAQGGAGVNGGGGGLGAGGAVFIDSANVLFENVLLEDNFAFGGNATGTAGRGGFGNVSGGGTGGTGGTGGGLNSATGGAGTAGAGGGTEGSFSGRTADDAPNITTLGNAGGGGGADSGALFAGDGGGGGDGGDGGFGAGGGGGGGGGGIRRRSGQRWRSGFCWYGRRVCWQWRKWYGWAEC